jgi:hypothetical protein
LYFLRNIRINEVLYALLMEKTVPQCLNRKMCILQRLCGKKGNAKNSTQDLEVKTDESIKDLKVLHNGKNN